MKRQRGTTLVELLVVLAVLGILAILLLPTYVDLFNETKDSTLASNKVMIQRLYQAWKNEGGQETINANPQTNLYPASPYSVAPDIDGARARAFLDLMASPRGVVSNSTRNHWNAVINLNDGNTGAAKVRAGGKELALLRNWNWTTAFPYYYVYLSHDGICTIGINSGFYKYR